MSATPSITPSPIRVGVPQKKGGSPEDARRSGDKDMLNIAHRQPADNLSVWIERGKTDIFTVTTFVTPDLARRILQRNDDNRPIRWRGKTRCVEAYSTAMQRGEWEVNGQAIIISEEGLLNDGQHRLQAVIAADMAVEMQITFGVRRNTRHTVDQGAARTPGNVLSMFGEKDTAVLAHSLQFVWAYDADRSFSDRPSPEQLLETLDQNPGLRDAVTQGRRLYKEFATSFGYMAAAFYVCSRVDKQSAEDFTHALVTGLNITDKKSPVFKLRKRFTDHLAKRESIPAVEQAALFIKAFNVYRRGGRIDNLMWRRYGPASEDFPRAA